MMIAVLSGKGGTGKTFVSVNLSFVADNSNYIDCDVEEPNGHLFFKPNIIKSEKVHVKIPNINNELCSGCRRCVDFCKFNALAYIKDKVHVFDEICHSCGGCMLLCPEKAISEKDKEIGEIQEGVFNNSNIYTGILNPGEETGVSIIKKLLKITDNKPYTFIDCPPGSSCSVMESIKDVDYCILVAEPTLFGVHNFNMVYNLVKLFDKPFGVVLNKCLDGENPAEKYCNEKNIKVLCKIPFEHELGKLNSNAEIASEKNEKYKSLFSSLLKTIKEEVK
ncbi:MAG TPA: ATP-binding protein [Sedimentibacter sp.]|jgi:MinD superfamily P-loop ATPase|nr:4Fe-4S binding protein [Tissierellia bacterium]HPB78568.1 ATP-binding protein [Sedimentibacter sp.]HQO94319.1 ATP-binding protein [Sedimentibacter sp.]